MTEKHCVESISLKIWSPGLGKKSFKHNFVNNTSKCVHSAKAT